jgi:hypothetical protein
MATKKKRTARRHAQNKHVSADATLWGRSSVSTTPVEIWLDPKLEGLGLTVCETSRAIIVVRASLLEDPLAFDETLLHEAVHVCEIQFVDELFYTRPASQCTQAAVVFGRELSRFLRSLRRSM